MSKVSALYHVVFCTKRREMTIPLDMCDDVYRFIWKEVVKTNSRLLRIGGIQNHIHMLIDLHPSVALSTLMQNVKARSSGWMRVDGRFPLFCGWASEYYACSISPENQDSVIDYIKDQKIHHLGAALEPELLKIYADAGLHYDDRDMM